MQRDLRVSMALWVVVIAFTGVTVGREAHMQTQRPSRDDSIIQENTRNAVVMMRTLASAQSEYREHTGNGEFGTAIDLFKNDVIDSAFANALGCPKMTSAKGQKCLGTRAPLRGYRYRLKVTRSKSGEAPGFMAVAVPAGKEQSGAYTFFVDQTQVIRASDSPKVEADAKSPALGTARAPVIKNH